MAMTLLIASFLLFAASAAAVGGASYPPRSYWRFEDSSSPGEDSQGKVNLDFGGASARAHSQRQ